MAKRTIATLTIILVLGVVTSCTGGGVQAQKKVLHSVSPDAGEIGIAGEGLKGVSIEGVRLENFTYGIKIGTGPQSEGISVRDITATNNSQALFIADLSNSQFTDLDLQCYSRPGATGDEKNHVIYLERGNHDLTFTNVRLRGGSGQTLQMYCMQNRDDPSSNITFDGLTITEAIHGPIVISGGYSHVTIKDLKATATGTEYPVIQLFGDATDITIDGFECWGGQALIGTADEQSAHAARVTVRNGIYHGASLVHGYDKIDDLVIGESVRVEP